MDPIVKSLDQPDERQELPKGRAELVHLGDFIVVRGQLEPGWRWSNDWRPIMGTTSCQMPHTGLVLSGRMRFEMDDGDAVDLKPGDVYSIPAGHDAWVVGDEPVRTVDWAPCGDKATERVIEAAKGRQPNPNRWAHLERDPKQRADDRARRDRCRGEAYMERVLADLESMPPNSGRNNALNKAAWTLGRSIALAPRLRQPGTSL